MISPYKVDVASIRKNCSICNLQLESIFITICKLVYLGMRISCKQKTLSISNSLVFLALLLQILNWLWITSKKVQIRMLISKRIWLVKWLLTVLMHQLEVLKMLINYLFSVFSAFIAYLALTNRKCFCNIIAWIPFLTVIILRKPWIIKTIGNGYQYFKEKKNDYI